MLSENQAKSKKAGSVAQVVQCLPRKHQALNSIPSTERKREREERKERGRQGGGRERNI
jgi:hypothetical protein